MPRKNRRIRDEDIARLWDVRQLPMVLPATPDDAAEPYPAEETADAA
jgi:hypothetical protein